MPAAKLLEIACFNMASAAVAQEAGADRIELCENYNEGGLTPSQTLIAEARQKISIPLHVIIRSRGGDFNYSEEEAEVMKSAVAFCRSQQVNGIVFGALDKSNNVDIQLCRDIIKLAGPMSFTFHRAIDQCKNIDLAMEQLIDLGVNRVLTSGGAGNVIQNISKLKQLQNNYGRRIVIMPGGGLRASNIGQVMPCGCPEYHSAAITGSAAVADAEEIKKMKSFLGVSVL